MPRHTEKLLVEVVTSEKLVDLKEHVRMNLSGAFGVEQVVSVEQYVEGKDEPKVEEPKVEEPKEEKADE